MKKTFWVILLAIFQVMAYGQRQDINTWTSSQQNTLACNIKNLLDNYHEDLIHRHTATTIHTTNNFFVWHKFYIHKVEKYLHSNFNSGTPESAPLPYWSPLNPIPNAFYLPGAGGGSPVCDRANNIPSGVHAVTFLPLEFQNINVSPWGKVVGGCASGRFNCPFNGTPTRNFYSSLAASPTSLCNTAPDRNTLTTTIGSGGGHHGNVHLAVGGCLGGDFHEAPGATLFSVWHSYLDKVWHDWECNCNKISGPDLYIADRESDDDMTTTTHPGIDMGYEPNEAPTTYPMWVSEDIWIRNQQDGVQYQEHENPEYSPGKVVYVYVRVRNRGCSTSGGNEQLKLYWAKANTSLSWPAAWTGSNTVCGNVSGGQIGSAQTVTPLQPDGYKIYMFEFTLPKPEDYNCVPDINHFCLLARITDASKPNDGMTFAETANIYSNVHNNNNIAWKNISILNDVADLRMWTTNILINRSEIEKERLTRIVFRVPFVLPKHKDETGNLLKYTQVAIRLDDKLYEAWKKTKASIKGVKIEGRNLIIVSNNIEIPVLLDKKINYTFQVRVLKPSKMPTYLTELKFDIMQMNGKNCIGGQRFVIPVRKYKLIKDQK